MATVPIQTTPSVQLSAQGPGQIQAGPEVTPVKNFAPKQIEASGNAMTRAANMATSISTKLQDTYNDARAKQLYTNYSRDITQIQDAFLRTKGENAQGAGWEASIDMASQVAEKYRAEADNDAIGAMFDARAQVLMTSTASNMSNHSLNELYEFDNNESKGQIDSYLLKAASSWRDMENEDSDFAAYSQAAYQGINDLADNMGLPKNSWQREKMMRDANQNLVVNIISDMANDDQFIAADQVLEKFYREEKLSSTAYQTLKGQLATGRAREVGVGIGDNVFTYGVENNAANQGTFEQAVSKVLMIEGGYVLDDAGAGPTNFGINGKANKMSGEEIRNLSKAKAIDIYKTRYWDAIKADDLPVDIRMMAFDAAVNQGPGTAIRMLKAAKRSDGTYSLDRFVALRQSQYRRTLNGKKFNMMPESEKAMYWSSWMNRMEEIENSGSIKSDAETGLPNVESMVSHIKNTVPDLDEQNYAITQVKQLHAGAIAAQTQQYANDLAVATEIAEADIGGYKKVPPSVWAKLTTADRNSLIEGPARGSDEETDLFLTLNPAETLPGNIGKYRLKLSQSRYLYYLNQGKALLESGKVDEKILDATFDNDMVNDTLRKAGEEVYAGFFGDRVNLFDMIDPDKKSGDAAFGDRIALNELFKQRIDEAQINKKSKLTRAEKQNLLDNILIDRIMINDAGGDTETRMFALDRDDAEDAYVMVAPKDGFVRERFYLANIPARYAADIVKRYKADFNNRYPTQIQIAEEYINMGKPRD
jgi:lysozyme family protein